MIKELVQQFVVAKVRFGIEAIWSDMYEHTFWGSRAGARYQDSDVPIPSKPGLAR
jgi:hypothetical protein